MTLGEDGNSSRIESIHAYPRVLIVNGEPFWQGSATGLTMSRLFMGWPKDALACLYASQIVPDRTICTRYWQLTSRDLRCIRFLLGDLHTRESVIRHDASDIIVLREKDRQTESTSRLTVRRLRKRMAGQAVRDLDIYQIPDSTVRDIEAFSPQIIYSMLGSNPLMQLVIELADRLAIPVVPHFMDDWPTTHYGTSIFKSVLRRLMSQRLAAVLARSPTRLVIGDAMVHEYSCRYGNSFIPFMNAVEPELLRQPITSPSPREVVRLVYVGGLHLNRWRSLQDIGMALMALRAEGLMAEVRIYTQPRFADEARRLDIFPVMRFAGSLSPQEIPGILSDADVVLHVEAFDQASRSYARYSVSTKIPESMCAARPILAYGPQELASIQYVQDSGVGLSVGQQQRELLLASLRELIASKSRRESLGATGLQVAARNHNAAIQRDEFRQILERVAASGQGGSRKV